MAYREVTMIEVKEVLRLWLAGRAKKQIAARVGLDPKTVRRYVRAAEERGATPEAGEAWLTDEHLAIVLTALKTPGERPRGEAWGKCEEHRAFIEEKLNGRVHLTKVRKLLRRQGIDVPYATLHRFAVAELGFGRAATTIPVDDCEPGEELQVDTGWVGQLEPDIFGKRRRFRAWIFTAVRSRHRFVYPSFREQTRDAIEACEAAWEHFGGVFRVLLPDNTKAIIDTADPVQPKINQTFLEYAQARGFEVDPTRVRSPKDKGRVERSVRHVREDCFGGEKLRAIEDAREHARTWCLRDYGMRRHTRTQRLPLEHFEAEERPALRPAPTERYDIPSWSEPKVARDQHVQVDKALYSVPGKYVGKKLTARADRTTVRLYAEHTLVKVHARQAPGGRSTDPKDFPAEKAAYAMRDIDFLRKQAEEQGRSIGAYASALLEGPLPWTRMRRVYRLLGLVRRYGSERVEEVCTTALEVDMLDVTRLQRMLERGRPASNAAAPRADVIPIARYLRDPKQYALPKPSSRRQNHDEGDDA